MSSQRQTRAKASVKQKLSTKRGGTPSSGSKAKAKGSDSARKATKKAKAAHTESQRSQSPSSSIAVAESDDDGSMQQPDPSDDDNESGSEMASASQSRSASPGTPADTEESGDEDELMSAKEERRLDQIEHLKKKVKILGARLVEAVEAEDTMRENVLEAQKAEDIKDAYINGTFWDGLAPDQPFMRSALDPRQQNSMIFQDTVFNPLLQTFVLPDILLDPETLEPSNTIEVKEWKNAFMGMNNNKTMKEAFTKANYEAMLSVPDRIPMKMYQPFVDCLTCLAATSADKKEEQDRAHDARAKRQGNAVTAVQADADFKKFFKEGFKGDAAQLKQISTFLKVLDQVLFGETAPYQHLAQDPAALQGVIARLCQGTAKEKFLEWAKGNEVTPTAFHAWLARTFVDPERPANLARELMALPFGANSTSNTANMVVFRTKLDQAISDVSKFLADDEAIPALIEMTVIANAVQGNEKLWTQYNGMEKKFGPANKHGHPTITKETVKDISESLQRFSRSIEATGKVPINNIGAKHQGGGGGKVNLNSINMICATCHGYGHGPETCWHAGKAGLDELIMKNLDSHRRRVEGNSKHRPHAGGNGNGKPYQGGRRETSRDDRRPGSHRRESGSGQNRPEKRPREDDRRREQSRDRPKVKVDHVHSVAQQYKLDAEEVKEALAKAGGKEPTQKKAKGDKQ